MTQTRTVPLTLLLEALRELRIAQIEALLNGRAELLREGCAQC